MPKSLPPEGRWVSFSVSVREADLKRIDAARAAGTPAEVKRSVWARPFVLAGLAAAEKSARSLEALREQALASDVEPVGDPAELARLSVEAHAAQIAGEAGSKPPARKAARSRTARPRSAPTTSGEESCPHPPGRVHKGLCGACGTNVGQR
jgi:hypothetical protein